MADSFRGMRGRMQAARKWRRPTGWTRGPPIARSRRAGIALAERAIWAASRKQPVQLTGPDGLHSDQAIQHVALAGHPADHCRALAGKVHRWEMSEGTDRTAGGGMMMGGDEHASIDDRASGRGQGNSGRIDRPRISTYPTSRPANCCAITWRGRPLSAKPFGNISTTANWCPTRSYSTWCGRRWSPQRRPEASLS